VSENGFLLKNFLKNEFADFGFEQWWGVTCATSVVNAAAKTRAWAATVMRSRISTVQASVGAQGSSILKAPVALHPRSTAWEYVTVLSQWDSMA